MNGVGFVVPPVRRYAVRPVIAYPGGMLGLGCGNGIVVQKLCARTCGEGRGGGAGAGGAGVFAGWAVPSVCPTGVMFAVVKLQINTPIGW